MKKFNRERSFSSEEAFIEATQRFDELTSWHEEPISSARVRFDEETNTYRVKSVGGDYVLNENGKYFLPQRAGIGGQTIGDLNQNDWVKVMNTCLPYRSGNMILNELEGEVYAAHSQQYQPISVRDIFEATKTILGSKFPKGSFVGGIISPEFASCEYSLAGEKEIVKAYEDALKESFEKSPRLIAPVIRVVTSNTSDSGANVYPCLLCQTEDGTRYTIMAGNALKTIHKGGDGIKKVRENLSLSMDMVNKSVENFIRLTYIAINHPQSCFLNIAKRLGLPKLVAMDIGEEIGKMFGEGSRTTAKFIYLSLTKILERVNFKTETDKWMMANTIGHALTIDYPTYDTKSCEWTKVKPDANQMSLFGDNFVGGAA